jgi:opacity protein-like surface antigen
MKKAICVVGCLVGMLMLGVSAVQAQKTGPAEGSWNVGLRSGYSISERNVDSVPINLHIGYILFKGKPWIFPAGAFEIATEPFLSAVTRHSNQREGSTRSTIRTLPYRPVEGKRGRKRDASIEAGLMLPVLSYHFDLDSRLSPYIEGGLGILYHDFKGYDLGGGFTFTEMAGAGLSYFLDDNVSLNVGYRFRHTSNASLYDENDGLNSHSLLAGFSYFLPQR